MDNSAIPIELTKILERVKKIDSGLDYDNIYNHNIKKMCFEFMLLNSNPLWKNAVLLVTKEIKKHIESIYNKRTQIFNRILNITETEVEESENMIEMEGEFGEIEFVPDFYIKETKRLVVDEDKSTWWKSIEMELKQYEVLLSENGLSVDKSDFIVLGESVLNRLLNLEVYDGIFFISNESKDQFERLYSDTNINEDEVRKMKIRIGVERGPAAYIFDELERCSICSNIKLLLDKYKIFYNGTTSLSSSSLKSDKSKFLEACKTDTKKLNAKYEIDKVIYKLTELAKT